MLKFGPPTPNRSRLLLVQGAASACYYGTVVVVLLWLAFAPTVYSRASILVGCSGCVFGTGPFDF